MRISDWSSDVCSSDLRTVWRLGMPLRMTRSTHWSCRRVSVPYRRPRCVERPPVGSFGVDSTAILIYVAEKAGKSLGAPEDRPELLSWLLSLASSLGPFSGQTVHFQFAAPGASTTR